MNLIKLVFGDYFIDTSYKTLVDCQKSSSSPNPDVYAMKGKRCSCVSEPSADAKIEPCVVKILTGNDGICARPCHGQQETFVNTARQIMTCNKMPKLVNVDGDGGAIRRWRNVPFLATFVDELPNNPKPYTYLKKKDIDLQFETWKYFMMDLLLKYKQMESIDIPYEVTQHTNDYLKTQNMVKGFVDDIVIETGNDNDVLTSMELSESYNQYCATVNDDFRALTKNKVTSMFKNELDNYLEHKKVKGIHMRSVWIGYLLKPIENDEDV
jgi:phage/plasmid-associated DNA primase